MNDKNINLEDYDSNYIDSINIIEEMKRSYLDYAMSVIISRALPDVRDGLKPVHRRILYAMNVMGLFHNKGYRKSAGVVGEVMGKYHPHGDASIYDALVRMVQNFSLSAPLIDGQGNFGSIDGDPPAAMRYTECRLKKISDMLLLDIDKETVDFVPNYDNREYEPIVLPARFPNLLVNGSGGIAVGMATNIPPHNLCEIINACIALIDNPKLNLKKIMDIVPGPDFPTGGIIINKSGIYNAYETGRGSIIIRAIINVENIKQDRKAIIVTDIPYQVNKSSMIEKIADLIRTRRIEGISDLRDESDREGYRVVIELKRDVQVSLIINQLYKYTPLQISFSCNMIALYNGKPEQMSLIKLLKYFISFREEIIIRRTKFLLKKARKRAHILSGLIIAVFNIDEIISFIRSASEPDKAKTNLMYKKWDINKIYNFINIVNDPYTLLQKGKTYKLSEKQVKSIFELKLQRLTLLGRESIIDEMKKISLEILDYLNILSSKERILSIIKNELLSLRENFFIPRRTKFELNNINVKDEDLIASEDMAVIVSHTGYIKRVPLNNYRSQRRGGKGRSGMSTKHEDFATRIFVANTRQPVLFFSSLGIVYKEKIWHLPIGTTQSRGKALVNILPLSQGERITTIMPLPENESKWNELDVMFATRKGTIRRNKLSDFVQVNRNGKIAMKLEENSDEILSVEVCTAHDDILLTTSEGKCIRFPVTDVRIFSGRSSIGVKGISLKKGDTVISMAILKHVDATTLERATYIKQSIAKRRIFKNKELNIDNFIETAIDKSRHNELKMHEQMVLTVSEFGYGKRVSFYDFRVSRRGGKGIKATDTKKSKEIGRLVAAFPVEDKDQIMLVSDGGQLIRIPVSGIRIASRSSKGVIIFNTGKVEKVISVERISEPDT